MHAQVQPDVARREAAKHHQACFVLGTNIGADALSDVDVLTGDKGQARAEGGFRFLKDPLFFVSSLFVKKPCRIQGLLMVMTLALLVYSVAQRRLRQELARQNDTIPHQIHQPTSRPTLRGVLQVLEGIARVRLSVDAQKRSLLGWFRQQLDIGDLLRLPGDRLTPQQVAGGVNRAQLIDLGLFVPRRLGRLPRHRELQVQDVYKRSRSPIPASRAR